MVGHLSAKEVRFLAKFLKQKIQIFGSWKQNESWVLIKSLRFLLWNKCGIWLQFDENVP